MNKEFHDVVLEIRMPAAFPLFVASIDKEVRERTFCSSVVKR